MIDLGSTEFHFQVASLPRDDFEAFSSHLFDIWDSQIDGELSLEDYALSLEVEEGSIKGKGKVLAGLGALYAAVSSYGSFIQGVDIVIGQVKSVGGYLVNSAQGQLGAKQAASMVKRRGGAIGQLRRIIIRVQNNEITVDEAMRQAAEIIGDDADSAPEFIKQYNNELINAPRFPQQTILPFDAFYEETAAPIGSSGNTRRPPKPEAPLPPSNQLRVEIWRQTKRGVKKLRVVEL